MCKFAKLLQSKNSLSKKKKTLPKSPTLVKQKIYKFAKLLQSNCISLPKVQKSDRIYITIQHEKHPYQLVYNCANIQKELHNICGYRRFVSIILLIFFLLSLLAIVLSLALFLLLSLHTRHHLFSLVCLIFSLFTQDSSSPLIFFKISIFCSRMNILLKINVQNR